MEKTGHYDNWEKDLDLVTSMGISHLRYGPPYYKTHIAPGKYDWAFTDKTFQKMRELKITPIVDLCHFGVPDWVGNFQNPDFPAYFAEYAQAFAIRFPYLQYYTPINEIFITATFSALYAWWNGRTEGSGGIFGYYRLPIMHTETNIAMPDSVKWLDKEWANVHQLKRDGVPVVGSTWYSLLHQVDWDSALRNDAGNVNELRLFDLNRQIMPAGLVYKKLIQQWKDVLVAESYGLNF